MSKNGSLREVIGSWYKGWTDEATTTSNGSLFHNKGVLFSYGEHFPLALHIGNKVLMNGDRYSNSTAKHQAYTIQQLSDRERVEIPFSALARALGTGKVYQGYNFDLNDLQANLRVIDQKGDTWIDTGRVNEKGDKIINHVLGACIFRYGYDEKARYFFSGIDETGLGTHRYFLTELVAPVETVAEGLESMKPQVVKDAEAQGVEVLRQGEWFFIRCENQELAQSHSKGYLVKDFTLSRQDGDTGHHTASEGYSVGLKSDSTKQGRIVQRVRGIVKHQQKDHKQCKLYTDVKQKDWYEAHHNIQVMSFNAVGNVD